MTKEEKELRRLVFGPYAISRRCELGEDISTSISALVRAVREECAKAYVDASHARNEGTSAEVRAAIRGRRNEI